MIHKILSVFKNKQLQTDHQINRQNLKMLYPFHFLFILLCSPKFSLSSNYIRPNERKWIFISLLSVCFVIIITIYFMYFKKDNEAYINLHGNDVIIQVIVFSVNVFYCIGIVMIFVTNTIHRQNNVSLIVMIQRLVESIDVKESVSSLTVWNWIIAIIVVSVNFFIFTAYFIVIKYELSSLPMLIRNYLYTTFDINFAYAIFIITLLTKLLNGWSNMIIKLSQGPELGGLCSNLSKTYQNILETYKLYENMFQGLVSTMLITAKITQIQLFSYFLFCNLSQ